MFGLVFSNLSVTTILVLYNNVIKGRNTTASHLALQLDIDDWFTPYFLTLSYGNLCIIHVNKNISKR